MIDKDENKYHGGLITHCSSLFCICHEKSSVVSENYASKKMGDGL
jgi:hypothetical protein